MAVPFSDEASLRWILIAFEFLSDWLLSTTARINRSLVQVLALDGLYLCLQPWF